MIKTWLIAYRIHNTYRVNSIIYGLKQIPIIKKFLPESLYKHLGLKTFANILSALWEIINIFLGKIVYFIFFYVLPIFLIERNDLLSFLTIFVFLSFIGAFINNDLFEVSKDKYYGIILMRMNAREYVVSQFLYTIIRHFIGNMVVLYWISFMFTFPLWLCLVLTLLVCGMKIIVGMYCSYAYLHSHRVYTGNNIPKPLTILLTICFFAAYACVFFQIYLPVFSVVILSVMMTLLGMIGLVYIFKFPAYQMMCKDMLGDMDALLLEASMSQIQEESYHQMIDQSKITQSHKKGFEMMNELFMKRHHKIIWRFAKRQTYILFVVVISLIIGVQVVPSLKENIKDFLILSLPYFVFIMYMLNTTKNITNAMFINCDHCMLNYAFFHEPKNLLKLFQIRLREMIKINLIPALVIAIGYVILLNLLGIHQIGYSLMSFISIISMSIFFSTHYLVLYYLLQPYNAYTEVKNPMYQLITSLTYFICFLFMNMRLPFYLFSFSVVAFCFLYCVIACYLVYKKGPQTFKIRS